MKRLNGVLLDTNVLSYILQRSPLGFYYERLRAGRTPFVACMTPEELFFGAEKKKWGTTRRRELDALIAECGVLPGDLTIARISARVRADRERVGRALEVADAWIAATALGYGLPLFTHDGDFEGVNELCIVTAQDPPPDSTDEPESPTSDATLNAAALEPCTHLLH